ncbi:hypothetical protein CLM84_11105 [Streptomyces albidoflavus]|nr:hypothetical protein CLM84_11105 [Streptomyces albidoflavus]
MTHIVVFGSVQMELVTHAERAPDPGQAVSGGGRPLRVGDEFHLHTAEQHEVGHGRLYTYDAADAARRG